MRIFGSLRKTENSILSFRLLTFAWHANLKLSVRKDSVSVGLFKELIPLLISIIHSWHLPFLPHDVGTLTFRISAY